MKDSKTVKNIIEKYISPEIGTAYIFGSRALNTHRPDSDLDILIDDHQKILPETLTKINDDFEQSDIPYKIDLVIRSRIDEAFYQKILPELKKL